MAIRRTSRAASIAALALALASCSEEAAPQGSNGSRQPIERLGLMTSLPLYWPLQADFADIANGTAETPWQRMVLEQQYKIEPLDTLSPIAGLTPEAPETDPLDGLERLAVVQPRGLSPADNVALDDWVRGGGRLLLVLDPLLTGDYDVPLGDPRRPADTALVAPVVKRWGLDIDFTPDETSEGSARNVALGRGSLPVEQAGVIAIIDPEAAGCELLAGSVVARCTVGDGVVTLIADAAVFEHAELAGEGGETLLALSGFSLR